MSDEPTFYDFGDDAPQPTDTDLTTVSVLVARLASQQAEVDRLEAELKAARAALTQTAELDLPEALIAVGHLPPTKTTIGGHKVEFTEKFRCGQLDSQGNPEGMAWLESNGHADLAKHTVTVSIPRGEDDVARDIVDRLRQHPAANTFKIDNRAVVPWNTLAGFSKELCDQGVDVPLETLRVQRVRSAKVVG